MSKVVRLFKSKEVSERDMDIQSFRDEIIRPALKILNLWSVNSEVLLLGTALTESNLDFLKQIRGEALSFFQIEEATYKDVCRYINRADNNLLKERVLTGCYTEILPQFSALAWNLRLACMISRIKYWMIPEKLPYYKDYYEMARYYKVYYNSEKGAATIEGSMPHFERAASLAIGE